MSSSSKQRPLIVTRRLRESAILDSGSSPNILFSCSSCLKHSRSHPTRVLSKPRRQQRERHKGFTSKTTVLHVRFGIFHTRHLQNNNVK